MRLNPKFIAITGATGFIGGSLAAEFLNKGYGVVALTRNDPDGRRTLKAVEAALEACNCSNSAYLLSRLEVVPFAIDELTEAQRNLLLACEEVWHSAAEMSFSVRKLESSYKMNVGVSNDLYDFFKSGNCQRFYYISTAFTGGSKQKVLYEVLHTHPHLVNPYQVTKWSAEMSLALRAREPGSLPVTLFRPAIVIGDTRSGYYPRQPFGLYTYFAAVESTRMMGARSVKLDIDPRCISQFVPIQDVTANALALSELDPEGRDELEIFHAIGCPVDNLMSVRAINAECPIDVSIGPPETTLDHLADCLSSFLKNFSHSDTRFDDSKLRLALGERYQASVITEDHVRTLFRWFSQDFTKKRRKGFQKKLGLSLGGRLDPVLKVSSDLIHVVDYVGSNKMKTGLAKKLFQFSLS